MSDKISIRPIKESDYSKVRNLIRLAFGQPAEARLVDQIRQTKNYLPALDLIAEVNGELAGHILVSKIHIQTPDELVPVLALAPLSVSPDHQKMGIGSVLIQEAISFCRRTEYPAVFVLGEPEFYTRFGFEPSSKWQIHSPYPVGEEYFMAIELQEDSLIENPGIVRFPDYFKEV